MINPKRKSCPLLFPRPLPFGAAWFLTGILSCLLIPAVWAEDKPCPQEKAVAPITLIPSKKEIQDLMSRVTPEPAAHTADATFLFQSVKQEDGSLRVKGINPLTLNLPQGFLPAYNLMLITTGLTPLANAGSVGGIAPATSFQDLMQKLSTQKDLLTTNDKLLYLGMLGDRLGRGYDKSLTNTTMDQVFNNLVSNGTQGGICGDIHTFLDHAAKALGFVDAGVHTGLWRNTDGDGGHYVMHFRDPKTGEYYVQNYGGIISTGAKTLTDAVDVSLRVLGPMTGVSSVGSRPDLYHAYSPRLSRWVQDQLDGVSSVRPYPSTFNAQLGNQQNTLAVTLRGEKTALYDEGQAFVLHTDTLQPDGKYSVDAVGAVLSSSAKTRPGPGGLVDEATYQASLILGGQQVTVPSLSESTGNGNPWSLQSLIFQGRIKGAARINSVTGKIEINTGSIDNHIYGTQQNQIRPGIIIGKPEAPIKVEAERTIEMAQQSWKRVDPGFQTSYDKISLIIDKRDQASRAYITYRGDVYLMEGIDKMAATGIRNTIKAAIPTRSQGEFSILADMSKMANNPSGDPFYEANLSTSVELAWKKTVGQALEMGAAIKSTHNQPYFLFEQPGSVSPGWVPSETNITRGSLWLRQAF